MEPQIHPLATAMTSPSSALKQNSLTGSNKSVKYRLSRIISVDDDTIEANEAAAASSSTNDNSGPLKSMKWMSYFTTQPLPEFLKVATYVATLCKS